VKQNYIFVIVSCICHCYLVKKITGGITLKTTRIYVDNKSTIALVKNLVHHEHSKHKTH
jgi:transcriptional regulator of met regulon